MELQFQNMVTAVGGARLAFGSEADPVECEARLSLDLCSEPKLFDGVVPDEILLEANGTGCLDRDAHRVFAELGAVTLDPGNSVLERELVDFACQSLYSRSAKPFPKAAADASRPSSSKTSTKVMSM